MMMDDEVMDYPENTVALATVRGVPDTLVLRRRTGVGDQQYDWAHTLTQGFTCSGDWLVRDVHVLARPVVAA